MILLYFPVYVDDMIFKIQLNPATCVTCNRREYASYVKLHFNPEMKQKNVQNARLALSWRARTYSSTLY